MFVFRKVVFFLFFILNGKKRMCARKNTSNEWAPRILMEFIAKYVHRWLFLHSFFMFYSRMVVVVAVAVAFKSMKMKKRTRGDCVQRMNTKISLKRHTLIIIICNIIMQTHIFVTVNIRQINVWKHMLSLTNTKYAHEMKITTNKFIPFYK